MSTPEGSFNPISASTIFDVGSPPFARLRGGRRSAPPPRSSLRPLTPRSLAPRRRPPPRARPHRRLAFGPQPSPLPPPSAVPRLRSPPLAAFARPALLVRKASCMRPRCASPVSAAADPVEGARPRRFRPTSPADRRRSTTYRWGALFSTDAGRSRGRCRAHGNRAAAAAPTLPSVAVERR